MRKWKMLDMLVATQVKMSGSEKEKKSEKEHIRHLLHETCNLGPVHRQVSEYFGIHNIYLRMAATVHTYPVNPTYISATFRIRSKEWTFFNTLRIRYRVSNKSGYFVSGDVTRSSPILYPEYSRWCRVQCYRFFTSWTLFSGLITCVQLSLAMNIERINRQRCVTLVLYIVHQLGGGGGGGGVRLT